MKLGERSYITVSIPLKEAGQNNPLSEEIRPYGKSADINSITLNFHAGQTATYRSDATVPGDLPIHGCYTREEHQTKYSTSPLNLEYFRGDRDFSLDTAWINFRKSIQY